MDLQQLQFGQDSSCVMFSSQRQMLLETILALQNARIPLRKSSLFAATTMCCWNDHRQHVFHVEITGTETLKRGIILDYINDPTLSTYGLGVIGHALARLCLVLI